MKQKPVDSREAAETIALHALTFLASDADRLSRFLALTGMGPQELRSRASEPAFLGAVLDHVLHDETLLLVFATESAMPPATIAIAHELLMSPEAAGKPRADAKIVPMRRR